MVDDLDRCTIENTLEILNSIKLFLSLKQCIFVIAVDMKKIELAWKTRYGKDEEILKEGTSYLEKIFQIRTNIPVKTETEIGKYILELIPKAAEVVPLISKVGPKNLRKIKRILNLASFHASTGDVRIKKYELSVIWILFEHLMKENWRSIKVFRRMEPETGNSFLKNICEVFPTENSKSFKEYIDRSPPFAQAGGVPSENDELMLEFIKEVKFILQTYTENYTVLNESMNEIVTSSEESNE